MDSRFRGNERTALPLPSVPYPYGLGLYNYEKIDTIIGSGTVRRGWLRD